MKHPLVLVTWEDHSGGTRSWEHVSDMNECLQEYLIQTVGFCILKTKDRLVLVQNYATANDMVNHHMTILTKTIKNIKILRKGKQ